MGTWKERSTLKWSWILSFRQLAGGGAATKIIFRSRVRLSSMTDCQMLNNQESTVFIILPPCSLHRISVIYSIYQKCFKTEIVKMLLNVNHQIQKFYQKTLNNIGLYTSPLQLVCGLEIYTRGLWPLLTNCVLCVQSSI